MTEIDDTDYALLVAIADAEKPLWKKRIRTQLQNHDLPLPGNIELSLQSIGRRINALHDRGLVDTKIVEPSNISQNMIIGYTLTEKGRHVLNTKRGDILGMYADWRGQDTSAFDDRETLLQILNEELELTSEEYEMLQDKDMEVLRVFTRLYHACNLASSTLDEQTATAFRNIIRRRQEHSKGEENKENGPVSQAYGDRYG